MNKGHEEFLADLRAHIAREYDTQGGAAKAWGVSKEYVSAVRSGKSPPNQAILTELGYQRLKFTRTEYVKIVEIDDE
jgi:hypothetical protein